MLAAQRQILLAPPKLQSVQFDGTNDFLSRGSSLAADGKVGICSLWFRMTGGDGVNQSFAIGVTSGDTTRFQVVRATTNVMRVFGRNSAGTTILTIDSTTTFQATQTTFVHFLAAWDLANAVGQVYINDVSDLAGGSTLTNDTIQYTGGGGGDWGVGGSPIGGLTKLNAYVGQLYLNISQTLDLSKEANRRRFISAGRRPVNLGASGERPTGTSPAAYFNGLSWKTNKGTGGGMTETGLVTTGPMI